MLPLARRLCNSLVFSIIPTIVFLVAAFFRNQQAGLFESRQLPLDCSTPDTSEVDEPRFLVIGKINNKHWSAITTYRNNKTRIISVRRSRKKEIEIYESL